MTGEGVNPNGPPDHPAAGDVVVWADLPEGDRFESEGQHGKGERCAAACRPYTAGHRADRCRFTAAPGEMFCGHHGGKKKGPKPLTGDRGTCTLCGRDNVLLLPDGTLRTHYIKGGGTCRGLPEPDYDDHLNPNWSRIWHVTHDGHGTDITEGVQALYDLVINSMDWTSGFFTVEDAQPVSTIAHLCGYGDAHRIDEYLQAREAERTNAAFQRQRAAERAQKALAEHTGTGLHTPSVETGKCTWPGCGYIEDTIAAARAHGWTHVETDKDDWVDPGPSCPEHPGVPVNDCTQHVVAAEQPNH